MKCPVCRDADLLMTERMGVAIDYCPQCRGIWLDRSELDKMLDKDKQVAATHDQRPASSGYPDDCRHGEERHHKDHHGHGRSQHHSRRRSWLSA